MLKPERNAFVHGVFVLDPELPGDAQWFLQDAETGARAPLAKQVGTQLVSSLNALSRDVRSLTERVADYLRTSKGR